MGVKLVLALTLAALALSACGAEQEAEPSGSTEGSAADLTAPLPDVARVTCESEGAPRVGSPAVKPQRDGVHLEFVNESGKDLSFSIEDSGGGGMGSDAPQGTSSQAVDLHPGTVLIACYDSFTEDAGEVAQTPLEIVDQDGLWIPATLDCALGFSGTSDYVEGARGKTDPLEAAQEALAGYMKKDDFVEPAGYPDTLTRIYRLVRAGETLGTVSLFDDGAGGWLADTVTGCSSLGE